MSDALKLAVVTDIHHGRDSLGKKGSRAGALLDDFVRYVDRTKPDFVIDLGDRITDTDHGTDLTSLAFLADKFRALSAPVHHLLGNHDLVHLSAEENGRHLGQVMHSTSIDLKGWHLVFWQANVDLQLHSPFELSEDDFAWLKADLASTNLPAIIFTHVPLDGASMTGNHYFENTPQVAGYRNVDRVHEIISQAGNVAACIAGHVHWNNVTRIDGIPYLSLQSLTESYTTQGSASGGWSVIELDRRLRWRCEGDDPIDLTVELGGGNRSWFAPLPPLSSLARERSKTHRDLADVKALIIDLDGVVYKGGAPIPGAVELLRDIDATGRKIVAVTNNARASSSEVSEKLKRMGFSLPAEHILTSGQVLADWLSRQADRPRVFFAAAGALRNAVLDIGAIESDEPDWVIASIDESLTIGMLNQAVGHLARGAKLLASNPDVSIPTEAGQAGETGAVVAFLEAASGRRARVFGKPGPLMFETALRIAGCDAGEAVVVGDTFATDILGANKAGLRSVWVQSGNPADDSSPAIPWLTVPGFADLRPMLGMDTRA